MTAIQNIDISLIDTAPQIRTRIDAEGIRDLAASIEKHGLLQPILVRQLHDGPNLGKYEIIAGERRFRAAKLAGLDSVPVLVRDVSDQAAAAMALIGKLELLLVSTVSASTSGSSASSSSARVMARACRRTGGRARGPSRSATRCP